jgi:hypothetical protein
MHFAADPPFRRLVILIDGSLVEVWAYTVSGLLEPNNEDSVVLES